MKVAVALLALVTACATTVRHDPLYDGGLIPEVATGENATFVRLTIKNNRSQDGIAPTFYLIGLGRHALGVVQGLSEKSVLVDTRWFPTDGRMRVVAHYTGLGEWVSEEIGWQQGYVIDVRLESIMSTSSAWAHK